MRIVIDLQGAQTESRFRGIGRYSLALAKAMIQHRGRHEIIVALSGCFPETLLPLRRELAPYLPGEKIRVWHAPGPIRVCEDGNEARRGTAELIREAFLAGLRPDAVLISSLFEGYVDDAAVSIRRFASLPTAVILYDLIPLMAPADYLPTEGLRGYYGGRVEALRKADLLLSISQSARRDAIDRLGISPRRVCNISSAVDPAFRPGPLSGDQVRDLQGRWGIRRKVVLCVPGGFDARKNIQNLIAAYARLPAALRRRHQLVIASRFSAEERARVHQWCQQGKLREDEVRLTGYLGEADLMALYRMAELFVFPSVREGFGLPALEAMACGVPTIGSDASSIPEVIGRPDALFDPADVAAMAGLMTRALEDEAFRRDLRQHGLAQRRRFSWDIVARRALRALEAMDAADTPARHPIAPITPKPKLAFVSPMPPQRTGIADYSAELLPALSAYYDIDVVTASPEAGAGRAPGPWRIRDPQWLRAHRNTGRRVLYQMGNSPFHQYMLALMDDIPGTVVLHDFFLSGLMSWCECQGGDPGAWCGALFDGHGYRAVKDRYIDPEDAKIRYPVNLEVLRQAGGVIVHSAYARQLAADWYGESVAADWAVIPHLRSPVALPDREAARRRLRIPPEAFVVGTFGFIDPVKCNHRLLEAWLASAPGRSANGRLVFVGENHGGDYGRRLARAIADSGAAHRITITGFAPIETFRRYLAAVDVAVQLRTRSRGETSGTVLDCMAHGVPTIVNAHGSLAELDPRAVWILPERFADADLTAALDRFRHHPEQGRALGERARRAVAREHAPAACAQRYAAAIEAFHPRVRTSPPALVDAICRQAVHPGGDLAALSYCIAASLPSVRPARRLYLDVSGTCRNDLKTGIERVSRSLVKALLDAPPRGVRIEPVQLVEIGGRWHYRHAHGFTLALLGCDPEILPETPIDPDAGDILLRVDLAGDLLVRAEASGLFADLRRQGVAVYSVVFDLLPIRLPGVFPPGADRLHARWLQAVARFDGALCISRAVAEDLARWLEAEGLEGPEGGAFPIGWFPLGADFEDAATDGGGLPPDAAPLLEALGARPTFLMVGTIEPRKGYPQALDAFSRLWRQNVAVNLVIVGREGWTHLPAAMRRDIPQTLERLRGHPERHRRLFWLAGISDAFLEKVYATGTCLLAASYGEGFGLPLIEAARRGLPILARDLPVFREVAGDGATYFSATDGDQLAVAVRAWLAKWSSGRVPRPEGMRAMSWKESAREVIKAVVERQWPLRHVSRAVRRRALKEHLDLIHRARMRMVSRLLPPGDVILDLGGANCPLYRMGYPHRFQKLYLIDLPPENRHDMYKEIVVDPDFEGGEVVIQYGDMTALDGFADESVDFVWSGQSIEHVSADAGRTMCREVYRVLKKGGRFCLDTPNRRLTEIHTRPSGGGFIHPEHQVEYLPSQLADLLRQVGFSIEQVHGICEMRQTVTTGEFHYEDFLFGEQITDNVDDSYIQFYGCRKE